MKFRVLLTLPVLVTVALWLTPVIAQEKKQSPPQPNQASGSGKEHIARSKDKDKKSTAPPKSDVIHRDNEVKDGIAKNFK